MSTTPDDECSFRVRLYCRPKYWVSCFGRIFLNGIVLLFCNLDDTEYFNMEYSGKVLFLFQFLKSNMDLFIVFQHGLPSLKCSEEDCLADFVLRRDTRMKYPGSCSLEFQSVMQILTKCMLRWDTKHNHQEEKGY